MEGLPGLILILMMIGATQRAQRNTGQNKWSGMLTGRDGTGRGGAERTSSLPTNYYLLYLSTHLGTYLGR